MAGTITHSWNGTVLTVTSDSGTSSADLAGTMGPRGPQGPAGVMMSASGIIDMTGYATEKWVNERIASVTTGGTIDLSDYYTKSEVDARLANVDLEGYATTDDVAQAVSDKATKTYVDSKVAGLATETFVTNKIAEAQLGGEGGEIDLSGYRTKDDNEFTDTLTITNAEGTMHIYSNGIQGADNSLWIGGDGEGCFTDLKVGTVGNYKAVATQEWVNTAIANALAALDGDEVTY